MVVFDDISSSSHDQRATLVQIDMQITKNPAWFGGVLFILKDLRNPPVCTQFIRILCQNDGWA